MKKSKLLIPLASLAGVATIAMPLVLTSCNDNEIKMVRNDSGEWSTQEGYSYTVKKGTTYKYVLENTEKFTKNMYLLLLTSSDGTYVFPEEEGKINGQVVTFQEQSGVSYCQLPNDFEGNITLEVKYDASATSAVTAVYIKGSL